MSNGRTVKITTALAYGKIDWIAIYLDIEKDIDLDIFFQKSP